MLSPLEVKDEFRPRVAFEELSYANVTPDYSNQWFGHLQALAVGSHVRLNSVDFLSSAWAVIATGTSQGESGNSSKVVCYFDSHLGARKRLQSSLLDLARLANHSRACLKILLTYRNRLRKIGPVSPV